MNYFSLSVIVCFKLFWAQQRSDFYSVCKYLICFIGYDYPIDGNYYHDNLRLLNNGVALLYIIFKLNKPIEPALACSVGTLALILHDYFCVCSACCVGSSLGFQHAIIYLLYRRVISSNLISSDFYWFGYEFAVLATTARDSWNTCICWMMKNKVKSLKLVYKIQVNFALIWLVCWI